MSQFRYQRHYRGPLKAVILDWAGTTIDFGCLAPAGVFIEVFKRRDVPITTEEAREPMGAYKKDHIRQITQFPSVAKRWQEVHGKPSTEDDIEAMYQDFIPRQLDCLAKYADLIPGTVESIAAFRARGLKIGSATGYTGEMMKLLSAEAKHRGYEPDSTVCATDVPAGRPEPWMCLVNAQNLRIYPMEAIVKIGDTLSEQLPQDEYRRRIDRAYERMNHAGAHYVVDAITDVVACLDDIDRRLASGERP
jgi:phosphonoacetaldehyde hydrolase